MQVKADGDFYKYKLRGVQLDVLHNALQYRFGSGLMNL